MYNGSMDESFSNESTLSLDEQQTIAKDLEDLVGTKAQTTPEQPTAPALDQVAVQDARSTERLLEVVEERSKTRVLFLTDDPTQATADAAELSLLVELGAVFDEIHFIVMHSGRGKEQTERLGSNVFVYHVYGRYRWSLVASAKRLIKEQLLFNGVLRPDAMVALTPFMAAQVAYATAQTYKRPWQVHVYKDPYDPTRIAADKRNKTLRNIANHMLHKAYSVRTNTDFLIKQILLRAPHLSDISTLPRFYNFSDFVRGEVKTDVHDTYPQYRFVMLTETTYSADSPLHDTFAAVLSVLRNPRIGLVVIGEGGAKRLFEEKVRLLGIERSVVFLTKPVDEVSLFRSADLFIATDTSAQSETTVMQAVGAGLPICAYVTDVRNDLFEDTVSAFLVEERDSYSLGKKISQCINTPALRVQFAERMRDIATYRLHEDRDTFLQAMRTSIEAMFSSENDKNKQP